ncbi:MAG: ElyC/SanA/YdcF family protein [Candidatus Kaelpia imicola]|nr:ElyC/SanA/YdcF family protein [Candidatus Kaelpia imicola]
MKSYYRRLFYLICSLVLVTTYIATSFVPESLIYSQDIARRSKVLTQAQAHSPVITTVASSVFTPQGFEERLKSNETLQVALIALDKDSTLTVSREPISAQSAERVADILQRGIKFLVITGSDAVNTFKCVVQPIRTILEERNDLKSIENLLIFSSVGSASFSFNNEGEGVRITNTNIAPDLLIESERYTVWLGIMKGFVKAVEEFEKEISALLPDGDLRSIKDDISVLSSQITTIDESGGNIENLDTAFKEFIGKYSEIFGDAAATLNGRLGIRDENVLDITITADDMEALGIIADEKRDFNAPKITFEIAHAPKLGLSVIKDARFTKIIMDEVKAIAGDVTGLEFYNGPTYVDIGRLQTKEEVVKGVMHNFEISDGAIILGGDSGNDVKMLSMDLGQRLVFRFYVGKHDQFDSYFSEVADEARDQVIQSPAENGPAEIAYLFSSILDGLGKPLSEFCFSDNEHSYDALITQNSIQLAIERSQRTQDIRLFEAQALLDLLDDRNGEQSRSGIGAPDFKEGDVSEYNPLMLLVGSPSPQAFASAATMWHEYSEWWGFDVPVVTSTGRGRGYKSLVQKTLRFFEEEDAKDGGSRAEGFRERYGTEIQNALDLDAQALYDEYNIPIKTYNELKEAYDKFEEEHKSQQGYDDIFQSHKNELREYEELIERQKQTMLTEAKVIAFILTEYGVPESLISLEEISDNTYSNMVESHGLIRVLNENKLFDPNKELKIHVVADGFHRLRSLLQAMQMFNQERDETWQINAEAPYKPILNNLNQDLLADYLEHMIGDPNGEILDQNGDRIIHGEIGRILERNLAEGAGIAWFRQEVEQVWTEERVDFLRTNILKDYLDLLPSHVNVTPNSSESR